MKRRLRCGRAQPRYPFPSHSITTMLRDASIDWQRGGRGDPLSPTYRRFTADLPGEICGLKSVLVCLHGAPLSSFSLEHRPGARSNFRSGDGFRGDSELSSRCPQPFAQVCALVRGVTFGFLLHATRSVSSESRMNSVSPSAVAGYSLRRHAHPTSRGFLNQRPPGFAVGIRPACQDRRRLWVAARSSAASRWRFGYLFWGSFHEFPRVGILAADATLEGCRRLDYRCPRYSPRFFQSSLIFAPSANNTRRLRQMIVASSSIRCRSVIPAGRCSSISAANRVGILGMIFMRQYHQPGKDAVLRWH